MTRPCKKFVAVVGVSFVLLFIAVIYFSADPSSTIPTPNGYHEFVRAGKMLTAGLDGGRDLGDYREMSLPELRTLALSNAEPLRIVGAALNLQSRVPVQNSRAWIRTHLNEMQDFIQLARAFCLAGRLAQLEGRTNDAVTCYLDLIRFAHESTRGGIVIDASTARTKESLGMSCLKDIQDSLTATQNLNVARTLEELDANRETWSNFSGRDFRYEVKAEFTTLFSLATWRVHTKLKAGFYQHEAKRRQAMLDFAVRAYELQTGEKPNSLTNLVPAFLKAIPKDPLTLKNLVPSL